MAKKIKLNQYAGTLITKNVPTVELHDEAKKILAKLAKSEWDSIAMTYVLSPKGELVGEIPIGKLVSARENMPAVDLMIKPVVVIHEHEDQERIAIEAIANDLKSMPVRDKEGKFLGAVTADKIIDVLHEEHLEDFLRASGIRGKGAKILDFVNSNIVDILKARLPWLIVGLFIGLVASFVVSQFEDVLAQNTALAFFISMVAYMSDSVGTQSETIFIRSQAILKFNVLKYVLREFSIGVIIGAILGSVAGVFATFISGDIEIGIILGVSLLLSMSIAAVLACITPIFLKWLKIDPAVGSGPFTTAIQDMISLLIYFSVAMTVISIFN
jgi:magnesium transporter